MLRRLIITSAIATVLLTSAAGVLAGLSFITKWGTSGTADGQFVTPTGISVDAAGNVYVAEGNGNRVQKFDNNGSFLLKFGIPGDVPGGFVIPSGVAVDSAGNIYVTDSTTDRVSKFNSGGTFLLTWGGSGSASGKFLGASGVAVDSSNNIYVSDTNNHRIQKFTSAGGFITAWGSSGPGDGQFNGPQGLATDSSGNVYVADTGNNRVQKFTSAGAFITKWGSAGSGNGQFTSPFGVGADSSGNVFVADTANNRIQSFSSTGTFQEAFGTSGSGDGQFSGPQDVAADTSGNIFVADTGNDRVQKLGTVTGVVANAGPDQAVECAGHLTSVTLDGTASTGGGTLTYTWKEGAMTLGTGATLTVSLPLGVHTITLTVSSSGGVSDDDTMVITIADTAAPTLTLNGPNPMTVECHTSFSDPGATVVDGCAGSFPAQASGTVNVNVPGTYMITYSANDPSGNPAVSKTRTVNVVDTIAPTINLNSQTLSMWPPNHKYHAFNISDFVDSVTDGCDTSLGVGSVVISQVTSDELENNGGDGNTLNDIEIAGDCKSVQLRAEREGGGDGRVYTITLRVRDASGNEGTASARVSVPKSQGSGPAIDSGPHYTVNGICRNAPMINPLDNADERFFVGQHFDDFLSRLPDQGGFDFWVGQITQCGVNQSCVNNKRLDVSNAFFFELEYQQTAAYVFRLYRAAYGNNQPFPNPDATDQAVPAAQQAEAQKIPDYAVFTSDRARLIGSVNLAQDQQALANAYVARAEFLTKYPANLTLSQFVDALVAGIQAADGADLSALKPALLALGSRGAVLYRVVNDDLVGGNGGISNRAFIDAEYNRAFVTSQYFGYLRRDGDIGGLLFWLGQVNSAALRDVNKQHAMVCSFITSAEYQLRFSSVFTHTNSECPH